MKQTHVNILQGPDTQEINAPSAMFFFSFFLSRPVDVPVDWTAFFFFFFCLTVAIGTRLAV
jgi:hypothetical protein